MATPVSKRLFIPGKNAADAHQPSYRTDMQTIENFNPINQLIAGTGVTLDPASGQGPAVTISSTGGGSSTPPQVTLSLGPDTNDTPVLFGPSDPSSQYLSYWFVYTNTSALSVLFINVANGWQVGTAAGDSAAVLPAWQNTPVYTGPDIALEVTMAVIDSAGANFAEAIGTVTMPSGSNGQMATTDFGPPIIAGSDLSFVNGTGGSGNGFVSAGGGYYFAGISGRISIPVGTTF